ncbi:transcriptional regulator [Flavimobilis marinus]|uniref:Transcriptional regulatory protein, C terminal n=1 Tax=Flavimobilis marinus TaxID=285351 RepID=A0A1I2CNW4_9MICO|nr:transcriptional regulator [Flavimobilis marinus]SFE70001.1 Transcriptional regulatory protein, C terminal [Flavimobilis marinus]
MIGGSAVVPVPAVPSPAEQRSLRPLVAESWLRSSAYRLDPDAVPDRVLSEGDLELHRAEHPLAGVLPVIHDLLVRHTLDAGLVVAIGDQTGRLLWVDGDRSLRRKAERMAFVAGADWSEAAAGTSAPGTALVLGRSVQIHREEHYARVVHPWSCSAVPVRDRASGSVVGVIDITGGPDAVGPVTLPLLEATVAAVEAELALRALARPTVSRRDSAVRRPADKPTAEVSLAVLGRERGLLRCGERAVELSTRHAEILALLAHHRGGLSADALAHAVYGRDDAVMTLRAEIVRLRRVLDAVAPGLAPASRPYRLAAPIDLDAHRVLTFCERGAHRVALGSYPGPVLPGSTAPGIQALRAEVSACLRETVLTDAGVDTVLTYARTDEGRYDVELWRLCLRLLPARSPKRAAVVAHLQSIESELA